MKIGYLMQAGVPDVRNRPFSGPANHVREVFKHLAKRGHTVQLVAKFDGGIWRSDDLETFDPVYVPERDKSLQRILERGIRRVQSELQLPYTALFESLRFARACRRSLSGVDVLYERMGWAAYGGALAARMLATPLVLEVNGDHLSEFEMLGLAPKGPQRWVSKKATGFSVKSARRIVASGDGWCERLIARWNVEPSMVSVVDNGSAFVESLAPRQLRCFKNGSRTGESMTLVFVGGMQPWQGVETLLSAFAMALRFGVDVRLKLVGVGPALERVQRLALERGVAERVSFKGQVPTSELASILANADVGVSPYCNRVEFGGLKIFDYKAAGLPTIASGLNGYPTCIRHESTGLIVRPCDAVALCDAIVRLAKDRDLRKAMGQRARAEAEQQHSWAHTSAHIERVLEQAVELGAA